MQVIQSPLNIEGSNKGNNAKQARLHACCYSLGEGYRMLGGSSFAGPIRTGAGYEKTNLLDGGCTSKILEVANGVLSLKDFIFSFTMIN